MNFVLVGDRQKASVHVWAPFNIVDDAVREAILPGNLAGAAIPDDQVVILVS